MTLFTQHNFSIVRQLADPSLTGPFYVRAVIRNAYTDAIITTINMTDKTGQRFKGDWKIPADPSGEGFWVSIVTSVYSDAGYTTKSTDYGDDENTYLVVDKQRVVGGSGGIRDAGVGTGGGLARRDIRDIVSEELQKVLPQITPKEADPIEFPDQKEYDPRFDKIENMIQDLKDSNEPPEKIDFSPIMKKLNDLGSAISSIEMPELDLSPVLSAIKDHLETGELTGDEVKSMLDEIARKIDEDVKQAVVDAIKNTNFVTSFVTHAGMGKENTVDNKEAQIQPPAYDIKKLTA